MAGARTAGAIWRERGVLAVGLLSALVLLGAALLPANDPEQAGKTALAQLVARTEQAVVAEWQRSLRETEPPAPAVSAQFVADARRAERLRAATPTLGSPNTERSFEFGKPVDAAASALLAEAAERLERGEGGEAAAIVAEVSAKQPSARVRVEALQIGVRAAVRGGELARARELASEAATALELDSLAAAETSLRAILAAAPAWTEAPPGPQVLDAVGAWCHHAAAGTGLRLVRDPAGFVALDGLPALQAWSERVAALPLDAARRALVADVLPAAAERALQRALPELAEGAVGGEWRLVPTSAGLYAQRAGAAGETVGQFVLAADLARAFDARARGAELLPDGLALDFRGDDAALGTALTGRIALAGAELGCVLRHADPEALVRGEARRQVFVRAALFVMAGFALVTGVLMARALRRERRLAELKTDFIASVSHELRTPLASILLLAENLEAGRAREPEAAQRYHGLIRREALRLARLVDDVLDFSRLERGRSLELRLEETAAAPAARGWAEELAAWAARYELRFEARLADLAGTLALDRDALQRALFNLAENARKHSGSKEIELGVRAADGQLVIGLRDHGRGVPVHARARVFEPFVRLSEGPEAAPGTGLGLAIVREIVQGHGGTIAVRDPDSGAGALFEIRLPWSAGEERPR